MQEQITIVMSDCTDKISPYDTLIALQNQNPKLFVSLTGKLKNHFHNLERGINIMKELLPEEPFPFVFRLLLILLIISNDDSMVHSIIS